MTASTHCSLSWFRILSVSYHLSMTAWVTVSFVMMGRIISWAIAQSASFHGERQYDTPDCSSKAIMCILVVFPPLLLQMDWGHLFFGCPCRCMMSPYSGRIYVSYLHRDELFLYEHGEYFMKNPTLTPSHPTYIDCMPIPIELREFSPLSSCGQNIENSWECCSVIYLWFSSSLTGTSRKQWFDNFHPRERNEKVSLQVRYFFHTRNR